MNVIGYVIHEGKTRAATVSEIRYCGMTWVDGEGFRHEWRGKALNLPVRAVTQDTRHPDELGYHLNWWVVQE